MKTPIYIAISGLLLGAIAPAHGAPAVRGVDVIVSKNGKIAHQGKTDASGNFDTGPLDGGSYVVEFRSSRLAGSKFSLTASGGKKKIVADSVAGEKFSGGGVAMKVDVASSAKITGQITPGSLAAVQGASAPPAGTEKVKAIVKVMNGKRYVWVPGPVGSNIRGRWAEEGSEAAALVTSNKKGEDAEALRRFLSTQDGGAATLKHKGDVAGNEQQSDRGR